MRRKSSEYNKFEKSFSKAFYQRGSAGNLDVSIELKNVSNSKIIKTN